MLCPNCNQEFTTKFCPSCGYACPESAVPATAVATAPPDFQPAPAGFPPPPVVVNNYQSVQVPYRVYSPKNRWIAFFLCFFGGILGLHRFYTGKIFTGILYLFSFGFFGVGVVLDLIMILTGSYTDKGGNFLTSGQRYQPPPSR